MVKEIKSSTTIDGRAYSFRERTHPMIRSNDPNSLIAKAELAFEDACRKVIERARAANTEIVIWRDGKIVALSPDEAEKELDANLAKRDSKMPR
jgi:hypothetical protein